MFRNISILLVAAFIAFGFGYQQGGKSERLRNARAIAELNKQLDEVAETATHQEIKRLNAERERDAIQQELEQAASESFNANRPALDRGGVRRLNRY